MQDPLSFRVAAQVNGALREYVDVVSRAVETELNSACDNPLVDAGTGQIVHNGNFHPIVMAIGFDALRVAVAHAGMLSERRMSHLWDAFFAHLAARGGSPSAAGPDGPPEMFGMALRYSAATLVGDLRHLAGPATLDVPPLDHSIEDHATGAPAAVQHATRALDTLARILSIELLLAADIIAVTGVQDLGDDTSAVVRLVRQAVTAADDRSPASIHRTIRDTVVVAMA